MRRVVRLVALVGHSRVPPPARAAVRTRSSPPMSRRPVTHGDAADDPALGEPASPASSLVIGNDKLGALETYNLDGSLQQRITTSTTFWGNVDVRQQATVAGRTLDVVATINAGLRLFTVDPATRMLWLSPTAPARSDGGGEGLCLYDSPTHGRPVGVRASPCRARCASSDPRRRRRRSARGHDGALVRDRVGGGGLRRRR